MKCLRLHFLAAAHEGRWTVLSLTGMQGGLVVSVLDCQLSGPGLKIPAKADFFFLEISALPAPPSQLSYDEYTDYTRLFESTTTVSEFHAEAPQSTASKGLAQGPYVAA